MANDSSTVQCVFAWQNASVAAGEDLDMRCAPACSARSYPRSFGTRQMYVDIAIPLRQPRHELHRHRPIAGIAAGLTKLVTSMRRKPAEIKRSISVSFVIQRHRNLPRSGDRPGVQPRSAQLTVSQTLTSLETAPSLVTVTP